jgi:hypothetical protein
MKKIKLWLSYGCWGTWSDGYASFEMKPFDNPEGAKEYL